MSEIKRLLAFVNIAPSRPDWMGVDVWIIMWICLAAFFTATSQDLMIKYHWLLWVQLGFFAVLMLWLIGNVGYRIFLVLRNIASAVWRWIRR